MNHSIEKLSTLLDANETQLNGSNTSENAIYEASDDSSTIKVKPKYSCDLCPRKFSFSPQLTRHTRIHAREKPYRCGYCSKRYGNSSNLKVHTRRVHKRREKLFI